MKKRKLTLDDAHKKLRSLGQAHYRQRCGPRGWMYCDCKKSKECRKMKKLVEKLTPPDPPTFPCSHCEGRGWVYGNTQADYKRENPR